MALTVQISDVLEITVSLDDPTIIADATEYGIDVTVGGLGAGNAGNIQDSTVELENLSGIMTSDYDITNQLNAFTTTRDALELALADISALPLPDHLKSAVDVNKNADELQWKSFSLFHFDDVNKVLMTAQNGLKVAENALNAAKGVVTAAEQVISKVEYLLILFNSVFAIFLNEIIDQLERFLKDLESTGVYFYDAFTYHLDLPVEDSEIYTKLYEGFWWRDDPIDFYKEDESDELVNLKKELKANPQNEKEIKAKIKVEAEKRGVKEANWLEESIYQLVNYKSETYEEFIDHLCDALLDPADVRPGSELGKIEISKQGILIDSEKSSYNKKKIAFDMENTHVPKIMRTGRPDFGPEGKLQLMVTAMAFSDISKLLEFIKAVVRIFTSFDKKEWGLGDWKWHDYNGSNWKETFNFSDMSNTKPVRGKSKYPYWVGINVGTILGPLFDHAYYFLEKMRNLQPIPRLGFLDDVKNVLKRIKKLIKKILEIIRLLNEFLEILYALLNIPTVGVLFIDSDKGTDDAVRQLRYAKGFFPAMSKSQDNIENLITDLDTRSNNENTLMQIFDENSEVTPTLNYFKTWINIWRSRYNALIQIESYTREYLQDVSEISSLSDARADLINYITLILRVEGSDTHDDTEWDDPLDRNETNLSFNTKIEDYINLYLADNTTDELVATFLNNIIKVEGEQIYKSEETLSVDNPAENWEVLLESDATFYEAQKLFEAYKKDSIDNYVEMVSLYRTNLSIDYSNTTQIQGIQDTLGQINYINTTNYTRSQIFNQTHIGFLIQQSEIRKYEVIIDYLDEQELTKLDYYNASKIPLVYNEDSTKMYFAGAMFGLGYPNPSNGVDSYFNYTEALKLAATDLYDEADKAAEDSEELFTNALKQFKKLIG